MDRSSLVPVHADAGGVTFNYEIAQFSLGGKAPKRLASPVTVPQTAEDAQENSENSVDPSGDDLPNFLAVGAQPADGEDPAEAAKAEAAPPSIISRLLVDYSVLKDLFPSPAPEEKANSPPKELSEVPWLASLRGMSSPTLRLHNEIVSLCSYLASTQEEEIARRNAISRVEDVVRSIWPDARLEVFGSFATGLYLPTSDVDAVILDSGCTDIPQGLKALATSMARRNIACNMQVISKARVPIVKFEESESGYNFDISFDVANGPEAAANVRGIMDRLPPMRPLVMVLKVFLHQRQLNEVYSGGVGSYALLVMVACFLQTHPSRRQARPGTDGLDTNLGCLLIDFFRFYGRALQQQSVGVSCRRGGFFFSKRSKGFFTEERPYLLSVEDPNDATNDLGKNSYNISRARMAFDYAYCRLTAPAASGESMLARIIRLDPALFCRQPVPLGAENSGPARDREHRNGNVERADRVNRRDGDGTAVLEVDGEAVDGSSAAAGDHAAKKKKKRRDRKRKQLERDGKPVDSAEERTEGDGKGEEEIEGGQAQRKRRRWGRGGAQRRKGGAPGPQQLPQRQEDPREKGRNEREGKRRRR